MKHLSILIELRGRELELRQAELAACQAVCSRVETNIERLKALAQGVGGGGNAGLALNAIAYKQSLLQLADQQRQELAQRRSEAGQAQQAVSAAAREQEVLDQLLRQNRAKALLAEGRRAQKQQDDLATQVWLRRAAP